MATTRIEMEGIPLLKRLIDRPTTTLASWVVPPKGMGMPPLLCQSDSWLVVSGIEASADDAKSAEEAARYAKVVVGVMSHGSFGWELCKTILVPPRQDVHVTLYDCLTSCPVRVALLGWVVPKEQFKECMP